MAWSIIQILVNFFQVFIVYRTLEIFYEKRFNYRYSIELAMVAMTILLCFINFNYKISEQPKLFVMYYLAVILANIVIFKGNVFSKFFSYLFLVVLMGISELISAFLIWFFTDINVGNMVNENGYERFLGIITSNIILFCIYMIIKRFFDKKQMNLNNSTYYVLVGLVMSLTVGIIISVAGIYGNLIISNDKVNLYLGALTLLAALISILSIALTGKIIKDMEKKHLMELELQQIKFEHKYFTDVNSALEELRILKHDMKGELAIIHGYNELNQQNKLRDHVEKKLKEMDIKLIPKLDIDNMITSFVNFKYKEAQSNNINMEIISNLSEEMIIYIDKEEICRILNNILNNAIEACKNCDEKHIKFLISLVSDYLVIKCENSYDGNIQTSNGKFQTLKKDKTKHGYGMKSIKNLAEKYNGFVSTEYNESNFKVEVQMLNKEYCATYKMY